MPGWQLVPYYHPAREVGGDFYDFIPLADGRPVPVHRHPQRLGYRDLYGGPAISAGEGEPGSVSASCFRQVPHFV
jgi:hypothetical protein